MPGADRIGPEFCPRPRYEKTPPKNRRGPITNNRRENYFIIAFLNIRSTFTLASSAF